MTSPRDSRSLVEQLALELVRDARVVSGPDREFLRRVLAESTGDRSLDAAVAERVTTAFAGAIASRIAHVLAIEVVRLLGIHGPLTPGDPVMPNTGPFAPNRQFQPGDPAAPLVVDPSQQFIPGDPAAPDAGRFAPSRPFQPGDPAVPNTGPFAPNRHFQPGDPALPEGPVSPFRPVPGVNPLGPLGPLLSPTTQGGSANAGNDPISGADVSRSKPTDDPSSRPPSSRIPGVSARGKKR